MKSHEILQFLNPVVSGPSPYLQAPRSRVPSWPPPNVAGLQGWTSAPADFWGDLPICWYMYNIYIYYIYIYWLVVSTTLKNIGQWEGLLRCRILRKSEVRVK